MRKALLAAVVAAVPMFVAVPAAHADDTTCTGPSPISGPHDNVVVPAGAFCILFGAEVGGNVKVLAGGILQVFDSSVAGDIQAEPGHLFVELHAGTVVGGDVQLKGSVVGFLSGYTDAVIGGDFQYEENGNFLVAIGGRIGGNVTAVKNTGGGEISGNTIGGNLECKENTPPIAAFGNVVEGETKCPEV